MSHPINLTSRQRLLACAAIGALLTALDEPGADRDFFGEEVTNKELAAVTKAILKPEPAVAKAANPVTKDGLPPVDLSDRDRILIASALGALAGMIINGTMPAEMVEGATSDELAAIAKSLQNF